MNSKIEELLQTEWPSTERHLQPPGPPGSPPSSKTYISWTRRLTPGFPAEWPFPPKGELLYYAYAAGLQPTVMVDGEWTTIPWARLVLTPHDGHVKFERLAQNPRIAGSQGVRALRPEEVEIFRESREVFEEFADALRQTGKEIANSSGLQKARRSYRFWVDCNGLVAREIRPLHTAFFEWLNTNDPVS
jgi:hypothetical protein